MMFIVQDLIVVPDGGDAHVNDGHIRHLGSQLLDHPCKLQKLKLWRKYQLSLTSPLAILKTAICPIGLDVEFELELHLQLQTVNHWSFLSDSCLFSKLLDEVDTESLVPLEKRHPVLRLLGHLNNQPYHIG